MKNYECFFEFLIFQTIKSNNQNKIDINILGDKNNE